LPTYPDIKVIQKKCVVGHFYRLKINRHPEAIAPPKEVIEKAIQIAKKILTKQK